MGEIVSGLQNDGLYDKQEIDHVRKTVESKKVSGLQEEIKQDASKLQDWVKNELIASQKKHMSYPYAEQDIKVIAKKLVETGNITDGPIKTFDEKIGFIREAMKSIQDTKGVDLHIPKNPDSAWFMRPMDESDFMMILAFQERSDCYKKDHKDSEGHPDVGPGRPDGIIGGRTIRALANDCGVIPEDIPSLGKVKTTQTWKMKQDGSVYLPGPDGKWKPYVYEQKKYEVSDKKDAKMEAKNLSVPMQKLNLFLQFAEGWKEEALKIANSRNKLNSSWVDNEGAQIKAKVAHLDAMIKNTITLINKNPSISIDYKKFFAPIYEVEMHMEDVIGQDDVGEAFRAINELSTGGYENAEHRIIKAMRKSFSDALADSFGMKGGGNSEYAKNRLAEENILKMPDYAPISKVLEDKVTADTILGGDVNGLAEQLKKASIKHQNAVSVAKEIIEQYNKLNKSNIKQRPEYIAAIRSQGVDSATQQHIMTEWNKMPGLIKVTSWNDYVSRAADEAIRSATLASTMMLARDLTMEAKLTQRIGAGKALTPQEKTMEDILGIGSFNISDENTEIAAEAGQTIALSAVTMGVGGLAARVALSGAKWLARIPRIASIMSKAANAAKTGTGLAKWAGKTAMLTKYGVSLGVEGVAFYQGSNLATNVITKDIESVSTLFENAGDWKENLKSVAFIGILKGMGNLFTRAAKNPTLAKLFTEGNANSLVATNRGWLIPSPRNLVSMHTLGNFGKIMIQGGMLTTTSQLVEFGFEGEMNWTWGEFFQACLLTRVMHGAGKLEGKVKFTKDPKTGEIAATTEKVDKSARPKIKVGGEDPLAKKDANSYTKESAKDPNKPATKESLEKERDRINQILTAGKDPMTKKLITEQQRKIYEDAVKKIEERINNKDFGKGPDVEIKDPVITDPRRLLPEHKTDANPVKTDANPVKTDANPVKTDANPVKTDANPVKTENLDGLKKRKGDLEGEIADRKAELEHKKKTAMSNPEKRGNSQGTGTFSPSEVIEYREQQRKLAEEQSIIDAKQKELDTINREINDINAQKILAQKESDHRSQHDQLYKDHEALLKALEDSYGSYNQAESSLKTKTATAGHRNDLESNLTQKEKNGQKILTDITKVEKEINQKRKADGLPEVDFDAIHNKVNKRPVKSGTGSNKPSGDIIGQKNTDAPKTGLVGLDGKPLSPTEIKSKIIIDQSGQAIRTTEQTTTSEITSKSEGVVDGKDTQVDPKTINTQAALDNAATIKAGIEAGQKAARGEVVTEKIKSADQVESKVSVSESVPTKYSEYVGKEVSINLGSQGMQKVTITKITPGETVISPDGKFMIERTDTKFTVQKGDGTSVIITESTLRDNIQSGHGIEFIDAKPVPIVSAEVISKSKSTKENAELSNDENNISKTEPIQSESGELEVNTKRNEKVGLGSYTEDVHYNQLIDGLSKAKVGDKINIVTGNKMERFSYEVVSKGENGSVTVNVEYRSPSGTEGKYGGNKKGLVIELPKVDERVKIEEEKQESQETKESQETVKNKLDAKKSEYSELSSQLQKAKLENNTQKVNELEQKIRDNVREVQDLKYQELVERYPEHAQTYKDWKSAQEQYGKAREDFFKDFADPSKEISDSQYLEARRNMHDLERKLRDLEWKDMSKEMREKSEKKFQDDMILIDERYNLAKKNTELRLSQKLGSTNVNIPVEIEKNNQRIAEIDKKLGTKSVLFDEHKRIDDAINSRIENVGKNADGKEASDSKEKKNEEGNKVIDYIKKKWSWGAAGLGLMIAAYACSGKRE